MPDGRTRWVLLTIAVLTIMGTGAGWYAQAHRPAPVIISSPASNSLPVNIPPSLPAPSVTVAQTVPVVQTAPPPVSPTPAPVLLYVHVAGAVRRPSLYQLPPGARVWHAVKAAGGATSKADLDALNLAEKVHDGEKVFVPTHAAEAAPVAPPAAAVAPAVPVVAVGKVTKGTSGKPAKLTSPAQGQVNINTAGADALERLPGIGPAMAQRILAYRQQAGRFASPDELQMVSGIGPKKYAKIAPFVKL